MTFANYCSTIHYSSKRKEIAVSTSVNIVCCDCIEHMRDMDECSVDSIVTDPPYGIAFMGAEWDSFNGRNGRETTSERRSNAREYAKEHKGAPRYGNSHGKRVTHAEVERYQQMMVGPFEGMLRVAKPGAHMLCFGGTRTFHRLMCAMEDAGWEIRDTIMWVYGSGFPKSMDVGKAIDKALGAEREKVENTYGKRSFGLINDDSWIPPDTMDGDVPVTQEARKWQGYGTCLKPAWEPIIVARKPLDGTVAHNVMTYGTGAINIDGCRVPTNDKLGGGMRAGGADGVWDRPFMHDEKAQADFVERKKANVAKSESLGRFPANLVHDGSQEVSELFPDTGKSAKARQYRTPTKGNAYGLWKGDKKESPLVGYEDEGSAARFFYCAKASKKDRGEGNDHPTVKPNALMRWLVRLVTPEGGVVLDPFMGSGSTGVAATQEGFGFIGIDSDEHYCDIARGRILGA